MAVDPAVEGHQGAAVVQHIDGDAGSHGPGDFVQSHIPDLDGGLGAEMVLARGDGTWHMASGEFRYPVPLVSLGGLAPGAGVSVRALYRSYFADPDGGEADVDATGVLPFGPGWLASFGDGILKDPEFEPGGPVIRVDGMGTRWVHEDASPYPDPKNPSQPLSHSFVYPGLQGSRMLYEDGTWYREFPDRTRIEYEQVENFGSLPAWAVGWRVSRIFRGKNPSQPLWEIRYVYDDVDPGAGVAIRLVRIEDSRGFHLQLTWDLVGSSGQEAWRVTKVGLTNPNLQTGGGWSWSAFEVDLLYDGSARLWEVRFPAREVHYDPSGDGTFSGLQTFEAVGLRFTYASSSDHRLTAVQRLFKTGGSWSSPVAETWLNNVYRSSSPIWRLGKQVERPGHSSEREHNFAMSGGNVLTWTDPEGIEHELEYVTQAASPVRWQVARYTRHPRTGTDPSGHGSLSWHFEWAGCQCGWLSSVVLPTGRRMEWEYDSEGRGLSVRITRKSSASDPSPQHWWLRYRAWGDPWDTGIAWDRASRLDEFEYADENGQAVVWDLAYALITGGGGHDGQHPQARRRRLRVRVHGRPPAAADAGGGTPARRGRRVRDGAGRQGILLRNGHLGAGVRAALDDPHLAARRDRNAAAGGRHVPPGPAGPRGGDRGRARPQHAVHAGCLRPPGAGETARVLDARPQADDFHPDGDRGRLGPLGRGGAGGT